MINGNNIFTHIQIGLALNKKNNNKICFKFSISDILKKT